MLLQRTAAGRLFRRREKRTAKTPSSTRPARSATAAGNGSIIGRNSFQRKKPDALKLLDNIMKIYEGKTK